MADGRVIKQIPEEIQERLAATAAKFIVKYGVSYDDITELMKDIIIIYTDYMEIEIDNTIDRVVDSSKN